LTIECFRNEEYGEKRLLHFKALVQSLLEELSETMTASGKTKLTSWSRVLEKPPVSQTLKKIPNILWNSKVHCHIHKNSQLLPALSQKNTVHIFFIIPVYLQSAQVHSVNWLKEVDECLGEGRSLALFYN
jgi:hypothetical protein